jgi:hypothetical protein
MTSNECRIVVGDFFIEARAVSLMRGAYRVEVMVARSDAPDKRVLEWAPKAVQFESEREALNAGLTAGRRWLAGDACSLAKPPKAGRKPLASRGRRA